MTVTTDQGRAITYLAIACRPKGAPRWDEQGIFQNVMKIADRNLPMVIEHVIRHASDPKAKTPGVIAGNFTPPPTEPLTRGNPKPGQDCGSHPGFWADTCGSSGPCAAPKPYDEAPVPPPSWTPGDTAAGAKAVRDALRAVRGNGNDSSDEEGL